MSDNIIDLVRQYSDNLQNGRTISTIHDALHDEVTELAHEMYTDEPGEDGIAGEAVDVILCAFDIIFKAKPEWTNDDIIEYARKKCEKWIKKYRK